MPNDPFATYSTSLLNPSYNSLSGTAQSYFQQMDPFKLYSAMNNQLMTNPSVSGGVRAYASNPQTYQKLYGSYLSSESQNVAANGVPKQSWYEYLRGQGQDSLRNTFYSEGPQERGFSLGGAPSMNRLERSY